MWIQGFPVCRHQRDSAYLIQRAAGSCRSWGLHRLEGRLWDSPAVLPRRPRRSGGLSHTSPSICVRGMEETGFVLEEQAEH